MTVSDTNRPKRGAKRAAELLTTAEVAETLQVSAQTVRRWRFDGDLPFFRLGYRTVRFRADDVAEFIERQRRQ